MGVGRKCQHKLLPTFLLFCKYLICSKKNTIWHHYLLQTTITMSVQKGIFGRNILFIGSIQGTNWGGGDVRRQVRRVGHFRENQEKVRHCCKGATYCKAPILHWVRLRIRVSIKLKIHTLCLHFSNTDTHIFFAAGHSRSPSHCHSWVMLHLLRRLSRKSRRKTDSPFSSLLQRSCQVLLFGFTATSRCRQILATAKKLTQSRISKQCSSWLQKFSTQMDWAQSCRS